MFDKKTFAWNCGHILEEYTKTFIFDKIASSRVSSFTSNEHYKYFSKILTISRRFILKNSFNGQLSMAACKDIAITASAPWNLFYILSFLHKMLNFNLQCRTVAIWKPRSNDWMEKWLYCFPYGLHTRWKNFFPKDLYEFTRICFVRIVFKGISNRVF